MQVELKNTTKKLCVIGDPVLHSKSPLLQNAMLQALGLDYIYLCQPVKAGEAARWLEAAKIAGYAGFNATMPHKEDLLPLMDELDEDDKLTVFRARKIQKFLSQPFHVAENFTGVPGVYVPVEETVRGFKAIIDGDMDEYPEIAFFNVGTIEDVKKKAESLSVDA